MLTPGNSREQLREYLHCLSPDKQAELAHDAAANEHRPIQPFIDICASLREMLAILETDVDMGAGGQIHVQIRGKDQNNALLVGDATFDVPAPATGRLAEKRALPNDPVLPGQVLGLLDVGETL